MLKMKKYSLILFVLLLFMSCLNRTKKNKGSVYDAVENLKKEILDSENQIENEKDEKIICYLDYNEQKEVTDAFIQKGRYTKPKVYTVRHLKSENGSTLKIATGEYEIYGDYKLPNETSIPFDGHQIKKNIYFKGFSPYPERKNLLFEFSGVLDLENNIITGNFKENPSLITFKPYKNVDFQRFKFETHSVEMLNGKIFINSIRVTNIYTDKEQTLSGFLIGDYINQIFLEDINCDGYFDLRIRDISGKEVFWGYNTLSDKFEPITVLNTMECELIRIEHTDEYIICGTYKYGRFSKLKFVPEKSAKGTIYFGIDEF